MTVIGLDVSGHAAVTAFKQPRSLKKNTVGPSVGVSQLMCSPKSSFGNVAKRQTVQIHFVSSCCFLFIMHSHSSATHRGTVVRWNLSPA